MISQGIELWHIRNNKLYNNDDLANHMAKILNDKIRQLYQLRNSIGYQDQDIFAQALEDQLKLSEKQKMTWIAQTTKTLKVSMAEYEEKQTTGQ